MRYSREIRYTCIVFGEDQCAGQMCSASRSANTRSLRLSEGKLRASRCASMARRQP